MKGAETNEDTLIKTIASRTLGQIVSIKKNTKKNLSEI
jgi:hypothetical protein